MKITRVLNSFWVGPWIIAALCALVLTGTLPQEADAVAVEYDVMLALIIVVCITAITPQEVNPQAWGVISNHLLTDAQGALDANSDGNRPKEIGKLSKAIGATEAMLGLTSSCEDCGDLRSQLQQILGMAGSLKSLALGGSGACKPDGVIQKGEQCDPLAVPTGCPVETLPTFCSEECVCEVAP